MRQPPHYDLQIVQGALKARGSTLAKLMAYRDPTTRAAVRAYQKSQGLKETGLMSNKLFKKLMFK